MNKTDDSQKKYTLSHLGIIRLFVIWGILEILIFYITNGDRFKELIFHIVVFVLINIIAFYFPELIIYL